MNARPGTAAVDRAVGTKSAPGTAETIHVLFCANPAYFQHAAVAAVSLAEAAGPAPIRLHLMTCDRDPAAEALLAGSLRPYRRVTFEIHHVGAARVSQAFVDRHLTKEAYLRFLAPEVLPHDIHRVLYLDCDVVVLDDIAALWEVDLAGRAVGAVQECNWEAANPDGRLVDLGLDPARPYVNSGVLVMDLDLWRQFGLADRVLGLASQLGPRLQYHDQDALNLALADQIQLVDRRWNLQAMMYSRTIRKVLPDDHAATAAARARPGVVHFTTAEKPWHFRAWVRRKALYYRFLDKTCWRDVLPPDLSPLQRAEHRAARSLLKIGVDPYALRPVLRKLRPAGRQTLASRDA